VTPRGNSQRKNAPVRDKGHQTLEGGVVKGRGEVSAPNEKKGRRQDRKAGAILFGRGKKKRLKHKILAKGKHSSHTESWGGGEREGEEETRRRPVKYA